MRSAMTLVVREPGDPETLAAPVRAAIRDHDPAIPMYAVRSLAAYVREDVVGPRSRAVIVATFATTANFLAASGLGGVLSFAVSRRRREIGLRMALGAGAGRVTRAVVWQAARVVGIGLVAGLAGAWIAGRAMSGFLFGVAPSDPAVLAVVVLLLGAIALVAAYVPARQAASVSPAEVLRAQ